MSKNTAEKPVEKAPETPEAAKPAGESDLGARTERDEADERDERLAREREERERFDPVMRAAHALQISALLDLHRLTSHGAGASSDARYLRAAKLLGDELAASIERAFEG